MPRQPRVDFPGAWHHVMNRGARRSPIFKRDDEALLFLDTVGEGVERFGVEVHAFSLMPNHYHLLVRSVLGNLSRAMQWVGSAYVQRLNRIRRWDGPVFKGRYRSQLVADPEHLRTLVAYIHLNPVRARLVRGPEEECWTSHRAYLRLEDSPGWLSVNEVLTLFGGRRRLRAAVEAYRLGRSEWPEWLDESTGQLSSEVVEKVKPRRKKVTVARFLSPTKALAKVRELTGATTRELQLSVYGPRANPPRRFAVWALARSTSLTGAEIGARLAMSETQVAKVQSRLRQEAPPPIDEWISEWLAWEEDVSTE